MSIDDRHPTSPDQEFATAGQALLQDGEAAWREGRQQDADRLFRELARRFPDHPEGFNKVGVVYAQQKDLDQAREWFQRALAVDGRYPPALTNLGNLLLEGGQTQEAIAYYTLALQHNPSYGPAHKNLAVALRRQGRHFEAVRHLRRGDRLEMGGLGGWGLGGLGTLGWATPPPVGGSPPPRPQGPPRGRPAGRPAYWVWLIVALAVVFLVRLLKP